MHLKSKPRLWTRVTESIDNQSSAKETPAPIKGTTQEGSIMERDA